MTFNQAVQNSICQKCKQTQNLFKISMTIVGNIIFLFKLLNNFISFHVVNFVKVFFIFYI